MHLEMQCKVQERTNHGYPESRRKKYANSNPKKSTQTSNHGVHIFLNFLSVNTSEPAISVYADQGGA
jgi:hypothetical protein